jgi:hypothetical protein
MPEGKEQVEAGGHREKAEVWLKRTVQSGRTAENRTADAAVAQVHALLAIHDQLDAVTDVERGPSRIGVGAAFVRTGAVDA